MDNNQLQLESQDILLSQDSSRAISLLKDLKKQGELDESTWLLSVQLQFIRISSLSTDQLYALLKTSLLYAYTIPEYDLSEKIEGYIDQIERMFEQIEVSRKIKLLLESSELVFSESPVVIKNQELPGTIKNWIADYNSYPSKDVGTKGAIDEIEYSNKSPNLSKLSDVQKGVIKNIIKLYDDLSSLVSDWDNTPISANETQAFKDFDLYEFIPGLEEDLEEEEKGKSGSEITMDGIGANSGLKVSPQQGAPASRPAAPPTTTPAAVVPQATRANIQPTSEQRRAVEDIKRAQHTPVNYNNAGAVTNGSLSASDSAKIRELINHAPPQSKRGVTMDPTNVKIDEEEQRLSAAREKQAADIQRKLAELRTRNTSGRGTSSDLPTDNQNKTK